MTKTKAKAATAPTTLAYCWASGLIGFTDSKLPKDALPIARGPDKDVREFVEVKARHGYKTRDVAGRPTRIPGTECLLVPGIPEAPDQNAAYEALRGWASWIRDHAPKGVTVLVGGP